MATGGRRREREGKDGWPATSNATALRVRPPAALLPVDEAFTSHGLQHVARESPIHCPLARSGTGV